MYRCFELARKGGKAVKSNPLVGAVLVYKDRIIGEGYHEFFGGPHAEVNAVSNVRPEDEKHISDATLYVSLEPCCIVSKTPACSQLIIDKGIKKVVVSATDPNEKMNGQSLALLKEKEIEVISGILEKEGNDLIRPFVANLNKRPYVMLKWAQSSDGYMGKRGKQIWLSNQYSKMKTHLWRSEVDGIMVGHNTVVADNPLLTTRLVPGESPLRIVTTRDVSALVESDLYQDSLPTLFITTSQDKLSVASKDKLEFDMTDENLPHILEKLFERGVSRVMIEGGSKTLKLFIFNNLWDEARVIKTNKKLYSGIRAPIVSGRIYSSNSILDDDIEYIYPNSNC